MNKILRINELLESKDFRAKPGMYLREKKISLLDAFLAGVYYSIDTYGVDEEIFLDGFHDFVAEHYRWKESTAGWKNILLKECKGDEEKALDEFFKLYDAYKKKG